MVDDTNPDNKMAAESVVTAPPEEKERKKKIAIMEPHEVAGRKRTKVYRKSVFPGMRESMDALNPRRQSSAGNILSSMMSAGFPSMVSRRWTSRRSTMYKAPRFQNTYQLEPNSPFQREKVLLVVDHFLKSFLEQHKHNPRRAKRLAENLSVDLRDMVKRCGFDRYRVVAVVTIGDKKSQDFKSVMRFVWDADKDGYVNFAYEAPSYFVIATVFAVYYE